MSTRVNRKKRDFNYRFNFTPNETTKEENNVCLPNAPRGSKKTVAQFQRTDWFTGLKFTQLNANAKANRLGSQNLIVSLLAGDPSAMTSRWRTSNSFTYIGAGKPELSSVVVAPGYSAGRRDSAPAGFCGFHSWNISKGIKYVQQPSPASVRHYPGAAGCLSLCKIKQDGGIEFGVPE